MWLQKYFKRGQYLCTFPGIAIISPDLVPSCHYKNVLTLGPHCNKFNEALGVTFNLYQYIDEYKNKYTEQFSWNEKYTHKYLFK